VKNPLTEYGHLILINAALLNFAPMGVEFHVKVRLEHVNDYMYLLAIQERIHLVFHLHFY